MTEDIPRKPVSRVSKNYIDLVQLKQGPMEKIGTFDLLTIEEFFDIIESDTSGDIELFMLPLTSKIGSGLLVAKYEDDYVAVSGIKEKDVIL